MCDFNINFVNALDKSLKFNYNYIKLIENADEFGRAVAA